MTMNQVVGACSISLALTAAASAQIPAGGEFRVNTYTTGSQQRARSAMEPDGDFVVVWESYTQDGSDSGAFGQRFAASGLPRGSEFQINTHTTNFQGHPVVSVGSGGDFVVVWVSAQTGASGYGIKGRLYDASGSAIGAEFLVNTLTTAYLVQPRVGRASDGRFVVSWMTYYVGSGHDGIAARRFDAFGNPIGSQFLVNTYTTGRQSQGDLAVEANGNFVAVWSDINNNRDGSGSAIFSQRFDASGTPLGSEFQVNSYTSGDQFAPSVSLSPAGGFVVAWSSQGDESGTGVLSRRFDASGNAVGIDFVVNTYTTGSQSSSYDDVRQVAHDAGGNFVVTWTSFSQDGSSAGTFAQRFSASGARRGAEFLVNTYTTGAQRGPSVASDAVGNFVVVWASYGQDGSNSGIFAQRYGDLIFEDGFESGP